MSVLILFLACTSGEVVATTPVEAPEPAEMPATRSASIPPRPSYPLTTSPSEPWQFSRGPELSESIGALQAIDGDIWAVGGQYGGVYRWNGAWQTEFMASKGLYDLDGIDGHVFCVGYGQIVHWDGKTWTEPEIFGSYSGVSALSSTDVWAVGGRRAAHFDGANWTEQRLDIPRGPLRDVVSLATDDVWAVGDAGLIVHWDGAEWTEVPSPTTDDLLAIATRGGQMWAVGKYGTILLFDDAWFVDEDVQANLADIVVHGEDLVAVGDAGALARRHNGAWRLVRTVDLKDIVAVAADGADLIVARDSPEFRKGGQQVLRGQPGGWDGLFNEARVDGNVLALWGASDDDMWAAGTFDGFLHFDGETWTPTGQGRENVRLWGSGPNDVWAAGDLVQHWDGRTWTPLQPRKGTGVHGLSADHVWVTTHKDVFAWDGAAFQPMNAPVEGHLKGVWAFAPDDLWVGGTRGLLLHWDGATWTKIETDTDRELGVFWGAAPDDLWVAGNHVAFRWRGGALEPVHYSVMDLRARRVNDLVGRGPNDIWASTTSQEGFLHWDGESWEKEPTQLPSWDALAVTGTRVWAGAPKGVIARRD